MIMDEIPCLLGLSCGICKHCFCFNVLTWILFFLLIGGVTFVSLERLMIRRGLRVKKRQKKLLNLCSAMSVSCLPLSYQFCFSVFFELLQHLCMCLCMYILIHFSNDVLTGSDIASGPVWMEYIAFLKSLPVS